MDGPTRWNFLCDAVHAGLLGVFNGVIAPFTLPLAIRLGASSLQVGLIVAAPYLANLLSAFWASLSSNSRKVPWVVIPNLLWCSLQGLIGLVMNPAGITGLTLGANFAGAAANPAYGALLQQVYPGSIRGRLMGYVRLVLAGAMLPTAFLAGRWIDRFGPTLIFPLAGLTGLLAMATYGLTREAADGLPATGPRPTPGGLQGLRLAAGDSQYRRFLLAILTFHGGVMVAAPLYSVYQVAHMRLSNAEIGYLATAWNVAWLVSYAVWGRIIDRRGSRTVVATGAIFYLALPLAYALGGGYVFALLGAACQGIADAAIDLGQWNTILAASEERVRPYTAAAMTILGIRGAVGPLLGSWLLEAVGFKLTFLSAAVLVAVGFALLVKPVQAGEA